MKLGSLCTGYGGLDRAVEGFFGAETAWAAEIDPHASRVLAERWPGVPNLGDLTTIEWAAVEPVDILTAGYPCQPFSLAGKRKGTDDPRHLWPHIAAAIRQSRPRLVVLENVAAHLGLGFDTVLGDLAALRFDAEWATVRASDAGAPHARARLFVLAWPAGNPYSQPRQERRQPAPREAESGRARTNPGRPGRTPAPDTGGIRWDRWAEQGRPDVGERRPSTASDPHHGTDDGQRSRQEPGAGSTEPADTHSARPQGGEPKRGLPARGDYGPAIARWERITGQPAPPATVVTSRGGRTLSAGFVEWMMGLPVGWVTDVVPNRHALRVLGNGVVPQQALRALSVLTGRAA